MLIGQISNRSLLNSIDYILFDICGLSVEESIEKYNKHYKGKAIILHGDWQKKVNGIQITENNIVANPKRIEEYIDIINAFKNITKVYGLTLHPITRTKGTFEDMLEIQEYIKNRTKIDVFIENRSSKSISLSKPEEVIYATHVTEVTIDIPQLYIACEYNLDKLYDTLDHIFWENVREIHLANIKGHFVARQLLDGDLPIKTILKKIKNIEDKYISLEILGGKNIVYENIKILKDMVMFE